MQRKPELGRSPTMKDQLLAKIHDHTAVVAGEGLSLRPFDCAQGRPRSGQALAVAFAD
jgi:hypothetical protein